MDFSWNSLAIFISLNLPENKLQENQWLEKYFLLLRFSKRQFKKVLFSITNSIAFELLCWVVELFMIY